MNVDNLNPDAKKLVIIWREKPSAAFRLTSILIPLLCPGHVVVELELSFVFVLHQDINRSFCRPHDYAYSSVTFSWQEEPNAAEDEDAKSAI